VGSATRVSLASHSQSNLHRPVGAGGGGVIDTGQGMQVAKGGGRAVTAACRGERAALLGRGSKESGSFYREGGGCEEGACSCCAGANQPGTARREGGLLTKCAS
jgi:hypothetical protein